MRQTETGPGGGETHLADVEVVAVSGQLRVVVVEHGGVDAVRVGDVLARVTGLDDMGGGTVLTLVTQADLLAGLEVVAGLVDLVDVSDRKLVTVLTEHEYGGLDSVLSDIRGDVLGGGNSITPVTSLDGVCPGACRGDSSCVERQQICQKVAM